MKYNEYDKARAKEEYDLLVKNGISNDYFEQLDNDYKKIRMDIKSLMPSEIKKSYDFDLRFGIVLHEYFNQKNIPNFNEAISSNYDFWRYLCIKVFPDIINARHGFEKEYFYEKNVRIYLSTLWWYIEFGYQGDYNTTYDALKNLSTDYILNIVERPGREGFYLEVMQRILHYFTKLPKDVINKKVGGQILLRRIMIQNTARINNFNLVIENKTDEYVKMLFKNCGVEV